MACTNETHPSNRTVPVDRLRRVLLDVGVVVALWCLLFGRCLFAGKHFSSWFGDMLLLSRPIFTFTAHHLLNGEFPLWNPLANYPNFAVGCAGALYPTTPLFGLVSFHEAYRADALAHILLAGLNCLILGRALYRGRLAPLVLALLVMSSPFLLAPTWGGNLWQIRVLAWLPLVVALLIGILNSGRTMWALGLGLVLGLQILGGDPQMFLFELTWLGFGTLVALLYQLRTGADTLKATAWKGTLALTAVILGTGIGSAQWMAGGDLMDHSVRSAGVTIDYILTLGELRVSGFLLNCVRTLLLDPVHGGHNAVFAGPITVSLMLAGVMGRCDWRRATLAAVTLFAIAFCAWPESGIARVVQHVPFIGQARIPMRMFDYATFGFYLFAGVAIDRFQTNGGDARRWVWGGLGILIALYTIRVLWGGGASVYVVLPVVALALGAVTIASRSTRGARWAVPVLAVIVALENLVALPAMSHVEDASAYALSDEYATFSTNREDADRVAVFLPRDSAFQAISAQGLVAGDRMIGCNHTLLLGDYARWLTELATIDLVEMSPDGRLEADRLWNVYAQDWVDEDSLIALDLLNIRHLVTRDMPLAYPEADIAAGGTRFRKSTVEGLVVYENRRAMPEVFAVHEAEMCPSFDDALTTLRTPGFDYRRRAVVTGAFDPAVIAPSTVADRIRVVNRGINDVSVDADMATAGLLVLTDVCYPGWTATVDGEPTEVWPTDGILRGVVVPSGSHEVRFEFRPGSVVRGFVVSIGALLSALAWAVMLLRRGRSTGSNVSVSA
ncbi:MAG: YfhO family protein [bacterium]|nr:YfhO family protein [bacterium]